jgi:hypothetical protein
MYWVQQISGQTNVRSSKCQVEQTSRHTNVTQPVSFVNIDVFRQYPYGLILASKIGLYVNVSRLG